jgi:hypothetical protein
MPLAKLATSGLPLARTLPLPRLRALVGTLANAAVRASALTVLVLSRAPKMLPWRSTSLTPPQPERVTPLPRCAEIPRRIGMRPRQIRAAP